MTMSISVPARANAGIRSERAHMNTAHIGGGTPPPNYTHPKCQDHDGDGSCPVRPAVYASIVLDEEVAAQDGALSTQHFFSIHPEIPFCSLPTHTHM